MSDSIVTFDLEKQEICAHHNTIVFNYDAIWHDGDIVCTDCGKYVRSYDAG